MLDQRRSRWAGVVQKLFKCFVSTGYQHGQRARLSVLIKMYLWNVFFMIVSLNVGIFFLLWKINMKNTGRYHASFVLYTVNVIDTHTIYAFFLNYNVSGSKSTKFCIIYLFTLNIAISLQM